MRLGWRYFAIIAVAPILSALAFIALFQIAKPFGAASTPEQLAQLQTAKPDSIILPFDLRYNAEFKIHRAELADPEIIWFSTSRAGTASADLFKPYRFYNMSFTAWTTDQLTEAFERTTRTARPQIAIISLDYFLFTDKWGHDYGLSRQMFFDGPWRYVRSSIGNFTRAAAMNRQPFEAYLRSPTRFIGTQGILINEGFKADGTWLFGSAHIEDSARRSKTAAFLIQSMPGAPNMSQGQMAPIAKLAEIARERGITLVAVQLPFLRAGIEFLDNNEGYRRSAGVWRDFESDATRQWLDGLGIKFFDLARSSIDDDPDNFIDAYHPSELGMQRTMRALADDPAFRSIIPRLAVETGQASH